MQLIFTKICLSPLFPKLMNDECVHYNKMMFVVWTNILRCICTCILFKKDSFESVNRNSCRAKIVWRIGDAK